MHIERRRFVRRAVSGGILFAALNILPLSIIELFYVLLIRQPSFDSTREVFRFILYLFLLPVCLAALLGVGEGLLILGVSLLTKVFAKRRVAEPKWMAWIYSILALPGIAIFAANIFAGRRARQIPGKDFIALALGLVGFVVIYGVFRLIIAVRDKFRVKLWGARQAALLIPLLLLLTIALYIADQRVLAHLYGFFHVALMLGAIGASQLAGGVFYATIRPYSKWIGRLAEPKLAFIVAVISVAGGAWSLNQISQSESLRFLYFEHTALQSKLLNLSASLGLIRHSARSSSLTQDQPPTLVQPVSLDSSGQLLIPGIRRPDANIILISVDAMRADHMGIYGYQRQTTPKLDQWARQGAVFERAYCQVPHTSFSVTSLMTGTYIYSLSALDPGRRYLTLPEILRRYGYKTAGFFPPAIFYIDRNNFTAFEESKFSFEYIKYEYLDAGPRIDQVLAFLKAEKQRRVFVWIHLFEPHEPYDAHPGFDFGPKAIDRYDGEIAYVDHHLGRLLAYVQKEMPNTIVGLTADHGEEFGEHGAHYHGNALYEQQVRVPFIIVGPGIKPKHIPGAVQVIDFPVTLLSLVDVPPAADMRGTDLTPWLAGENPKKLPPAFVEMERKKMVIHQDHKLLCDMARNFCELYHLKNDPGEQRNIIGRERNRATILRNKLNQWMASHVSNRQEKGEAAEIAALLARGRQKDPGAIAGLIKLSSGELEIRREAVRLLTWMRAAAAKEALIKATQDKDPEVRFQALVGAAFLGDKNSLDQLPKLLKRPDLPPLIRRDTLLALARAGVRESAVPLANYLVQSKDVYEKIELIETLGKLGNPQAAPALKDQLAILRTRLAAIEALGQVRAHSALGPLLASLQNDQFISWRKASARALGLIGDTHANLPLQQTVRNDLEAPVVTEALIALQKLKGLPVPGINTLQFSPWVCNNKQCTLETNQPCPTIPKELLLIFIPSNHPKAPLNIYCGTNRISAFTAGSEPAAVINLPAGYGPLRFQAPAPVPTFQYGALRNIPGKSNGR